MTAWVCWTCGTDGYILKRYPCKMLSAWVCHKRPQVAPLPMAVVYISH